jgi:hypothetical protein
MFTAQLPQRTANHLNEADANLLVRLRIALSIHKRAGWHLVRFTTQNGVVQLAGVVPTFYDRQLIASLVRHVAGVFGIEDNLNVGDPSIRQQVIKAEATSSSEPPTDTAPSRDAFRHLPILAQSLDDILVAPTVNAIPSIKREGGGETI